MPGTTTGRSPAVLPPGYHIQLATTPSPELLNKYTSLSTSLSRPAPPAFRFSASPLGIVLAPITFPLSVALEKNAKRQREKRRQKRWAIKDELKARGIDLGMVEWKEATGCGLGISSVGTQDDPTAHRKGTRTQGSSSTSTGTSDGSRTVVGMSPPTSPGRLSGR